MQPGTPRQNLQERPQSGAPHTAPAKSLLAVLAGLKTLSEDFPRIDDRAPDVVEF